MTPTTITDVRTVGVTVSDQDAALAFFVDTLGFEKRLDAPISPTMRWVEVAPPGAKTSIALTAAEATADVATDTGVRFTVPDAAAEHAAFKSAASTLAIYCAGRASRRCSASTILTAIASISSRR